MNEGDTLNLLELVEQHQHKPCVTVCSLILLNDDAQVLLAPNSEQSGWSLPMVAVNSKETAIDAAVRISADELGIDLLGVEPIGLSTGHESNRIERGDSVSQLTNFIFSSTHWESMNKKEQPAEDLFEFYSTVDLPEINLQSQHVLDLFKHWLPSRVLQFS